MNDMLQTIRLILRRWWLIVIPVVIVAVVAVPRLLNNETAGAGGYATLFKYSAAQEEANLPNRDGDYQDVWLASEFVVNAFTEWIRSSTFRDELGAVLGDSIDPGLIGIATDNARSIGVVQMSYPTADGLEQIAQAAIDVLQTRNAAYFPHLGGQNADVTIVDAPVIVPNPPPLPDRFGPIIQLGLAFFFGLILAFIAAYTDPYIRDENELKSNGFQVLAKVPRGRR